MVLSQRLRRAAGALHMCVLLTVACTAAPAGETAPAHTAAPATAAPPSSSRSACGAGSSAPCSAAAAASTASDHTQQPQVVVFGDSLSDVGNVFNLTGGFVPSHGRYWAGRFADGAGWLDDLAAAAASDQQRQQQHTQQAPGLTQGMQGARQLVEAEVLDFAYGGSTACASQARVSAMVPGLAAQVDAYLAGRRPAAAVASHPLLANAIANRDLSAGAGPQAAEPEPTRCTQRLLRPQPRLLPPSAADTPGGGGGGAPSAPRQLRQRTRRVVHVWTGHNDFLGGAVDWADPLVGPSLAANVSTCIGAALDRLVAAAEQEAAVAAAAAAAVAAGAGHAATAGTNTSSAARGVTYLVVWTLAPVDLAPALPEPFRPAAAAAVAALNADLAAHVRRIRRQQQQRQRLQQQSLQSLGGTVGGAVGDHSNATQPELQQKRKLRHSLRRMRSAQGQQQESKPAEDEAAGAVSAGPGGTASPAVAPAPAPAPPGGGGGGGLLVVPLLFDAHAAISCAALQPDAVGLRDGNSSCLKFSPPRIQGLPGSDSSNTSASVPLATGAFLQIAAADAAEACADPSDYLWYDGMHLTAAANARLIAAPLRRAGLGLLLPALL
ncbi:hypothetical protein HXX76_004319 [Chlamydomonas incerta]|uniref:SGNH hydrolase-type esterase domain-containing protein n=1 Tax=Chlamydomonas incerta TaxID=51695 RepID=A0A835TAQ5_CHLIN|nr:hypothetical protein HXX76_004319 [Chlamydomonas incerta]|eukprot:KAG2440207.1 hypothetical protein HXX76_004319 [Chlamydomonas incerta]